VFEPIFPTLGVEPVSRLQTKNFKADVEKGLFSILLHSKLDALSILHLMDDLDGYIDEAAEKTIELLRSNPMI